MHQGPTLVGDVELYPRPPLNILALTLLGVVLVLHLRTGLAFSFRPLLLALASTLAHAGGPRPRSFPRFYPTSSRQNARRSKIATKFCEQIWAPNMRNLHERAHEDFRPESFFSEMKKKKRLL